MRRSGGSVVSEPILRAEDLRLWESWKMTSLLHARSREFARKMDSVRRVVEQALGTTDKWAAMWSAGKDSTALAHLIVVEMGLPIQLISEKDDLDYPGEREYVERLAAQWKASLRVVTPSISPAQWFAEHAGPKEGDAEMHARSAGLSKACFYDVVEKASSGFDGIFLGLRKAESKGRLLNRITHGLIYQKANGQYVAQPLGDWSGLDVFAYMHSREIEWLPVYQCIALMHAREPWRLRKSWWIPGASARHGQVTWLRHYWPELYLKLREWLPNTQAFG
jgi:3'-phosphoadenosine 5'-phosphosulfate sulfotransferase (PAPS reductase)/FAD synthetase